MAEDKHYTADEEINKAEIASSRLSQTFDVDSDLVRGALTVQNADEFNLLDATAHGQPPLVDANRLQALLQAASISKDKATDAELLRLYYAEESGDGAGRLKLPLPRALGGKSDGSRAPPVAVAEMASACTDEELAAVSPTTMLSLAAAAAASTNGSLDTDTPTQGSSVEDGESLLSLACSAGYYELAQVLLAMRTNIEDRGCKGDCTPLMEAASAGHLDIVKLLLSHSANVDALSRTACTPLMYACAGGHEMVVNALLDAGADVNVRNENGHCALMEAASAGHVPIARSLVKHGAHVLAMATGEFKESPLTLAAYKGHIDMVKFLLKAGPKAAERKEELHTALMEASMDGHLDVAKALIDFGAPVNLDSENYESPLTLAACGGHVELVRLLLDKQATMEDSNDEGYTPLMEAAREGHIEVVELLLDRGAEINVQTEDTGETALTLAACGGFRDVVDVLVSRGADIDLGANSPLMEAAQEGHLDVVVLLIQLIRALGDGDVTIDATTATGDTALSYAAENGHVTVCLALLDAGAEVDHSADGGATPLMKAAKTGHWHVCSLLLSRGAQSNARTHANDETPLSAACAHGHYEVVQLLLDYFANVNHVLKDNSTCMIEAARNGYTRVVQLLLDWPGLHLPQFSAAPPSLQQLAAAQTHTTTTAEAGDAKSVPAALHSCAVQAAAAKLAKLNTAQAQVQEQANSLASLPPSARPTKQAGRSKPQTQSQQAQAQAHTQARSPLQPPAAFKFSLPDTTTNKTQEGSHSEPCTPTNTPPTGHVSVPAAAIATGALPATFGDLRPLDIADKELAANEWALLHQARQTILQHAGARLSEAELKQLTDMLKSQFRAYLPNLSSAALASLIQDVPNLPLGPVVEPGQEAQGQSSACSAATTISANASTNAAAAAVTVGMKRKASADTPAHNTAVNNEVKAMLVNKLVGTTDGKAAANIANKFDFASALDMPPPSELVQPTALPTKVHASTQVEVPLGTKPAGTEHVPRTQQNKAVDLNTATESNHDTALTIACAGGHIELVQLLLQRGAAIEHRDKKGFTPLILAATAGHVQVVDTLMNAGAAVEAQSERTKDTALSLACSGGRKEVVELLLKRGANKEHRNVSDYTPLSLAASGGYVDIIMLLLNSGAEINSRTGSKLGISPLMLASMNGHTAAVKILLERGSDINAQIETNRNTALTLACFQGRHEVVKLLLEYKANWEHRAKTGLTPLMEAASGGYVEVGRVLLMQGADSNATPVPSSRDTALTISADKGHHKFVDLLLRHNAQVDARNKKGCTSLWLACHCGHLDTVQTLVKYSADVDATDNRRVTPLMVAFRKGHLKVVKWLVRHVQQYPSDQDCARFIATITDKELLIKCRQCMDVIVAAKDRQALEANKAAETLLEQLAKEEEQAQTKKLAKQRQKEKKKAKKAAKKAAVEKDFVNEDDDEDKLEEEPVEVEEQHPDEPTQLPPGHKLVSVVEDLSESESEPPSPPESFVPSRAKRVQPAQTSRQQQQSVKAKRPLHVHDQSSMMGAAHSQQPSPDSRVPDQLCTAPDEPAPLSAHAHPQLSARQHRRERYTKRRGPSDSDKGVVSCAVPKPPSDDEWQRPSTQRRRAAGTSYKKSGESHSRASAGGDREKQQHPEDPYISGWREVRRKSNKLTVAAACIARVIGRGGQNINAIREATGAHIEVDKQQQKKEQDRNISIRGTVESTRQAVAMIQGLIDTTECVVSDVIRKVQREEAALVANQQQHSQRPAKSSQQSPAPTRRTPNPQPRPSSGTSSTGHAHGTGATTNVWVQRANQRQQLQAAATGPVFLDEQSKRMQVVDNNPSPPTAPGPVIDTNTQVLHVSTSASEQSKAPGFKRPQQPQSSASAHSQTATGSRVPSSMSDETEELNQPVLARHELTPPQLRVQSDVCSPELVAHNMNLGLGPTGSGNAHISKSAFASPAASSHNHDRHLFQQAPGLQMSDAPAPAAPDRMVSAAVARPASATANLGLFSDAPHLYDPEQFTPTPIGKDLVFPDARSSSSTSTNLPARIMPGAVSASPMSSASMWPPTSNTHTAPNTQHNNLGTDLWSLGSVCQDLAQLQLNPAQAEQSRVPNMLENLGGYQPARHQEPPSVFPGLALGQHTDSLWSQNPTAARQAQALQQQHHHNQQQQQLQQPQLGSAPPQFGNQNQNTLSTEQSLATLGHLLQSTGVIGQLHDTNNRELQIRQLLEAISSVRGTAAAAPAMLGNPGNNQHTHGYDHNNQQVNTSVPPPAPHYAPYHQHSHSAFTQALQATQPFYDQTQGQYRANKDYNTPYSSGSGYQHPPGQQQHQQQMQGPAGSFMSMPPPMGLSQPTQAHGLGQTQWSTEQSLQGHSFGAVGSQHAPPPDQANQHSQQQEPSWTANWQ